MSLTEYPKKEGLKTWIYS